MSLQVNSLQSGWILKSLIKSQTLKVAHAIRKQAAKMWKCKVTEILLSVCVDMARKGEKLNIVNDEQFDLFEGEKVRTTETIKAELKALEAEYKAALKKAEQMDLLQSDWTSKYGFNRPICQDKYVPMIKVLEDELFALEWTLEVTVARRAAWNASVLAYPKMANGKLDGMALINLAKQNGFTADNLARAMQLHNIKRGS